MTTILTFTEEALERIENGEKKTTIRLSNKSHLDPGETVLVANKHGSPADFATIVWVKKTKIRWLSADDLNYHKTYSTMSECIGSLQSHYDEVDIGKDTEVTLLRFSLDAVPNHGDFMFDENEVVRP